MNGIKSIAKQNEQNTGSHYLPINNFLLKADIQLGQLLYNNTDYTVFGLLMAISIMYCVSVLYVVCAFYWFLLRFCLK